MNFSYSRLKHSSAASFLPASLLVCFLVASLCIGGASRENPDAWFYLVSGGVALLWVSSVSIGLHAVPGPAVFPLALLISAIVLALLQLVPFPYEVWSLIPSNGPALEAQRLLALSPDTRPLTLTPNATLVSVFWFIPPLAVLLTTVRLSWRRASAIARWLMPVLALGAVILGLLQLFEGRNSIFVFHEVTNFGSPTGPFANKNHQASFLLMSIPFLAALAGRLRQGQLARMESQFSEVIVLTITSFILLGIFSTGAVAAYLLAFPTLLMSYLIYSDKRVKPVYALLALVVILVIVVATVVFSPFLKGIGQGDAEQRLWIWDITLNATKDSLPTGSGLGSFVSVIPLYEDPENVPSWFWNHAHNDYLEFVLEFGLFGVLIIAVGLIWFSKTAFSVWRAKAGREGSRLKKAAVVALLVCIFHSIVDYPLRTAAISCFVAFCVGILVLPVSRQAHSKPEARPSARDPKQVEL